MGHSVAAIIEQSYLDTARMRDTHIDESHLRTVERVGIVVGASSAVRAYTTN